MSHTASRYYYLRDILEISQEGELRIKLASLMISAQLVGAMIAMPAGESSNNLGRKPVIYLGCCVMAFTFLIYIARLAEALDLLDI